MWQSADPILGKYLDGDPNGGIYVPSTLSLYSYGAQNPVRYKDDNGEFVNFLIGAGIGAGLDLAVQVTMIATGNQKGGINVRSLFVSAGSGALGVGIAAKTAQIGNLGVKLLAEVGADATVAVGSKLAKGEEVTAKGVALDVLAGQAGGKALGKFGKDKAASSEEAKLLDKAANRAERIANNPKVGRPEARARQAEQARGAHSEYIDNAEIRAGAVGSGAGQSGSEIYQKLSEPKNE